MADSDIDEAVASLPEHELKRIDEAFDRAVQESPPEDKRPRKRRRIAQDAEPELAGGFLIDGGGGKDTGGGFVLEGNGDNGDDAGGFVLDDDDEQEDAFVQSSQPTHIPLSLIPRALQLLDLDPSDQQVLSVFENAASSWSGAAIKRRPRAISRLSDEENEEREEPEQVVGRRDWRAVCAALMPTISPLSSLDESPNDSDSRSVLEERELEDDSGSSAVRSAELEESESSSDEYIPEAKAKGKGRARQQRSKSSPSKSISQTKTASNKPRKGKAKAKDSSSDISSPLNGDTRSLTARQRQDTLAAFALFFPDKPKGTRSNLTDEELSNKRLTIRDVANAAASIKEKITAEEIIEMLSFFSSPSAQNNPSMSFQEFQQMMVAAKLA